MPKKLALRCKFSAAGDADVLCLLNDGGEKVLCAAGPSGVRFWRMSDTAQPVDVAQPQEAVGHVTAAAGIANSRWMLFGTTDGAVLLAELTQAQVSLGAANVEQVQDRPTAASAESTEGQAQSQAESPQSTTPTPQHFEIHSRLPLPFLEEINHLHVFDRQHAPKALVVGDSGAVAVISAAPGQPLTLVVKMQRKHDNLAMCGAALGAPPVPEALTAGMDGRLLKWDVRFGNCNAALDVTADRKDRLAEDKEADANLAMVNPPLLQCMAVNASSTCIIAGLGDGSLAVIPQRKRADGFAPVRYLEGVHTAGVCCVAFVGCQPDSLLVSAGHDRRLCVWQAKGADGRLVEAAAVAAEAPKPPVSAGKGRKSKGKPSAGPSAETLSMDGGVHGFEPVARRRLPRKINAVLTFDDCVAVLDTAGVVRVFGVG